MAGITQEKLLYLKVTKGRLIHKKGETITHDFGGYEGLILGIREKEGEFEGKKTVVVEIKMKDIASDEIVIVQATKKAWWCLGFFARIEKADLTKPLTIGVLPSDQNEKMSFCYLKQSGETIKSDKDFPKYTTMKISGEDVQDWAAPFARFDSIIKSINEKLATNTSVKTEELVPNTSDAPDDLPF